MKKLLALLVGSLAVAATLAFAAPAFAASDDPVIVHAPQSYLWSQGDDAEYFCTVEGDPAKLFTYTWHIVYEGKDYVMHGPTGADAWETPEPAKDYGVDGDRCYFKGIRTWLDGADIYCVVSRATGSVTSPVAKIMVTKEKLFFPPEITAPVEVFADVGEKVTLTVKGSCRSGNVTETKDFITYEWMECGTPNMESAILIGWKTGDLIATPSFSPSTAAEGVFYYICRVTDGAGNAMENVSYSNVIKLTVQAVSGAPGSGSGSGSGGGSGSGSGSGSGGGTIISSSTGGGTSVTVTTDGSDPHSVTVTTDPGNQGTEPGGNGGGDSSMNVGRIVLFAAIGLVAAALIAAIVILALKNKKTKDAIDALDGGTRTRAGGAHAVGAHAKPQAPAPTKAEPEAPVPGKADDDWK